MKIRPLKQKIIFYFVVGWLIPIGIFVCFLLLSYGQAYAERTEKLVTNGMKNAALLTANKIDDSIQLVQRPTYERDWEAAWTSYSAHKLSENEFLAAIRSSLKMKYHRNEAADLYAFYLKGQEAPKCYSSRVGHSYNEYITKVDEEIQKIIEDGTNYVQVRVIDNHVYLVRNLYTVADYQMYGTLVVRLNSRHLFDGFPMEQPENTAICFDGGALLYSSDSIAEKAAETGVYDAMKGELNGKMEHISWMQQKKYRGYLYEMRRESYSIAIIYALENKYAFKNLYRLYRITGATLALLLPFILYAFFFLQKQIEIPVMRLVQVSKVISEGKIGTKVEGESMPNTEFAYLVESFNKMSGQVKYLVDSVYKEQIMRKDAQIMALQAQINPHFLNNTLEMMNWQARMEGDVKVCRMIEALGTVLDHSMNRSNRKTVYLSEELRCVDSYLYIMSMRFGQRMQVERKVDEALLRMEVPQLILQPIIENAILHGVERVKSGIIQLNIYHDMEKVCLEVINTCKEQDVSPKRIEHIRRMLSGDKDAVWQGSGKHTSIGMRNVNERIRLVYGEEYGLFVSVLENSRFLSQIVLPYVPTGQE